MCSRSIPTRVGWISWLRSRARSSLGVGAPADQQVGTPITEFVAWPSAAGDRPVAGLGVSVPAVAPSAELSAEVRSALDDVSRPKDAVELERMRAAERATRAGFCEGLALLLCRKDRATGADRA